MRDGIRRICLDVDLLVRNGGIPAGKAMMLLKRIDCGNVRLSLKQLMDEERRKIAGAMEGTESAGSLNPADRLFSGDPELHLIEQSDTRQSGFVGERNPGHSVPKRRKACLIRGECNGK